MKRILLFSLIVFTLTLPVLALDITTYQNAYVYEDGLHQYTVHYDYNWRFIETDRDPASAYVSINEHYHFYTGANFYDVTSVLTWNDSFPNPDGNVNDGGNVLVYRIFDDGTWERLSYQEFGNQPWW